MSAATFAPELVQALDTLDAAGGRLSVEAGRLRVDVDVELPDAVWSTLKRYREQLVAALAGDRQLWADDGPIWRDGPEDRLPLPAGVDACDRCGSTETRDQTIHDGRSVRRDCGICGRFRRFVIWNGDPMP